MGRGVRSSGGGQSSLGYLFGSDPAPAAPKAPCAAAPEQPSASQSCADARTKEAPPVASRDPKELPAAGKAVDGDRTAGLSRNSNNYQRAGGQNTGNFITDRPSTKVHSAPGGGSSLGYLFGGN